MSVGFSCLDDDGSLVLFVKTPLLVLVSVMTENVLAVNKKAGKSLQNTQINTVKTAETQKKHHFLFFSVPQFWKKKTVGAK